MLYTLEERRTYKIDETQARQCAHMQRVRRKWRHRGQLERLQRIRALHSVNFRQRSSLCVSLHFLQQKGSRHLTHL